MNMIIVYGGTFNPPTLAHQKIASHIIKVFNPERFILLPVGDSYTWKDMHISFEDRFNMLKIAFSDPIFEISNLENDKEYKGTYYTLNQIKKTYKTSVYFLLGADNVSYLNQWIQYDKLIKEFHFIVLTRKGFNIDEIIRKYEPFESHFEQIDINLDISSSLFRSNPKEFSSFVSKEVLDYIKENGLYEV